MNHQTEASNKDVYLYSVGNIANTALFNFVGMYIMFYYTNVLGISATVAGSIFLVARLIDAVTDPVMGMIIDRTNTKDSVSTDRSLYSVPRSWVRSSWLCSWLRN